MFCKRNNKGSRIMFFLSQSKLTEMDQRKADKQGNATKKFKKGVTT